MSRSTSDPARSLLISNTGLSPSVAGFPNAILLSYGSLLAVHTPEGFLLPVCPLPRSLATTYGISFDVSSSPYLDVSVQAVPSIYLFLSSV